MPLATVCGSEVLNSACSAFDDGSSWLVGGAPGTGGRRLKSGGIPRGALVVTANSSGDCFCRPAMLRNMLQPDRTAAQASRTTNFLILKPRARLPASAHRK